MRHLAWLGLITTGALAMTIEAGAARADEPAPAVRPAFAMLDNTGDGAGVDLSLPFLVSTSGDTNPGVVLRPRLAVQDFLASGLGGYGVLQASGQLGGVNDHEFGIGNLEIGALYRTAISPQLDLGARVGAVLATATDRAALLVNQGASVVVRPADLATSLHGNWLRLGLSPTYHDGTGFARVDVGVDVPVTSRDAIAAAALAHLNAGAGVAFDRLAATAEVSALIQLGSRVGEVGLANVYTAGASLRYQAGAASPYLAASIPLGNDITARLLALTAGVTVAL